jgi:TolB-like protein/Tfp pilus assembly protein PilF
MERRLAAILAADVVGYSARMEQDEAATLRLLTHLTKIIDRRVETARGRVFSRAGDGFLAEFQSPVSGVRAAFDIQRDLAQARRENPEALEMRIGVHLADVVIDGDDLLGDGVNIAARIEGVSEPGEVTVSQPVFDQVKRTAYLTFESLGPKSLKNLSEPILLYRVVGELDNHSFISGVNEEIAGASLPSAGVGGRPSVAVIPFVNRSGNIEQDYFADGFSEDLITELSRFNTLFVSSRNASLAYRGHSVRVGEAGRHLGVDYCLEGSVRRMGPRLRLSVQLSRTDTEESIWADRYDCTMEEIFDVQDEIAARIVSTVAGRVETTLLGEAKRKRPSDMNAHECLLRGLEHHRLGGVTLNDARSAVEWFEKAIEIDPDYARAHAWRSCSRHTLGEWLNDDWWDESLNSVKRALELDENDAEAHRIMGVMCMHSHQWDKSRRHFERALEINPNHANVVARAGEIYNFMGDPDMALDLVARALRLDPFLPDYYRELEIAARYGKGDYAAAVRAASELTRMTRRSAAYRASAARHIGDPQMLAAATSELLRIDPEFRTSVFIKTEYYRDPAMRDRLAADLSAAGLPD